MKQLSRSAVVALLLVLLVPPTDARTWNAGGHRQDHGGLQNRLLPLHSHSEAGSGGQKSPQASLEHIFTPICSVP